MNCKQKLLILFFLINSMSTVVYGVNKYNSQLIVSGSDMWERIEGLVTPGMETVDHNLKGGEEELKGGLWVNNGATVHNLGSIASGKHKYQSNFGSLLGIGWVENKLIKEDFLVALDNNALLLNDGDITMGQIAHKCNNIISVADLAFYRKYSDYTKNVILANDSRIYNTGAIKSEGDIFEFQTVVAVDLLKYNYAKYTKNVVNMTGGYLQNTGSIIYGRDEKPILTDYVGVDLLTLGINYEREVVGIRNNGGTIDNEGDIFIGGDLFKSEDNWDGIVVSAIGVDLVGTHNKYGIKSSGGTINNSGRIEIERNYTKGMDENNTILDLALFYDEVLGLGLLNFDTFTEVSIGVSLDNGVFNNNNGEIKVGTNVKGSILDILFNKAIGIQANNKSTVNFNGGKIELEGTEVWAASLTNESNMIFTGNTDIVFQTDDGGKDDVNTDIFGNDGSGTYLVKGDVNILGKTIQIGGGDSGYPVQGGEEFAADLTIGKTSNIYLGVGDKVVKEDNPSTSEDETTIEKHFGTITATGKIDIETPIKIDGKSIYDTWQGQDTIKLNDIVLVANEGITYDGEIIEENSSEVETVESGSFLYNVTSKYEAANGGVPATVTITEINRENMMTLLENQELGNILESNFSTATSGQSDVYRYLAGGEDKSQFERRITEITGRDTLTTLNSQIYDITKDLNKQFKVFAKTNIEDGVVFKYINSKSELGANSSTVGFDRKSSGIMIGYNNSISEKLRLGAGFSYMKSDIDYTSASSNDVTTWNFRGYSDYDLGYANLFNDLSFGYNQSENKRLSEGVDSTGLKEGDLDVYSLSLNNSLYKNYQLNNKLSLSTSLNLDFTYLYQEDYKENGAMAASSDSADAFYITAGVGVDGKYNLASFGNSKINLVAGMEYAYDVVSDTEKTKIKMKDFANEGFYHEETRELDKKSLTYDIGVNYEYNDRYSLGLKYSKELINDIDNDQIGIDFTYKF